MGITLRTDRDVEEYVEQKAIKRFKELKESEAKRGLIVFDLRRDLLFIELKKESKFYNRSINELINNKLKELQSNDR